MSNTPHAIAPDSPESLLDIIPQPLLTLTKQGQVGYANLAAQEFFGSSLAGLQAADPTRIFPFASPLPALVAKCLAANAPINEFGVEFGRPPLASQPTAPPQQVDLHVAPISDALALVVVQPRSTSRDIDRLARGASGAARQVHAMSAMLAHEIKNPLSGIRGAAQLLEIDLENTELTQLICNETDRITALVDQFEQFGDTPPSLTERVNIHEVLERVRLLAENGFAAHVQFSEEYDPSLPPVLGDKNLLVQAFLNLVKNAAEAIEAVDSTRGKIKLRSAFRHQAMRQTMRLPPNNLNLPLEFSVIDNGGGIAEDIKPHLFDAFVSSKMSGKGLGLALVAKIIGEHGGAVECESFDGQTAFHIRLPAYKEVAQ